MRKFSQNTRVAKEVDASMEYAVNNPDASPEDAFMEGAKWADEHPHWISVEDELPENYHEVIVSVSNHFCYTAFHCGDKWYFNDNLNKREISPVTHWMPLPQPPKKGK